jgi:hypothetical protein
VGPRAGLDEVADRNIPISYRESNPVRPARSLVAITTEVPRLLLRKVRLGLHVPARFEVFTAVKIQVVFWIVTSCSDAVGYQSFGEPYYLYPHPEDGSSMVLRIFDILQQLHISTQRTSTLLYSSRFLIDRSARLLE